MKRLIRKIVLLIFIIVLLNINLSAQDTNVYTINPRLSMSEDGSVIGITGRSVADAASQTGSKYLIDIYDTVTGNLILEYNGSEFPITAIALDSNGQTLSYTTIGGQLVIVDATTGSKVTMLVEGGGMEVDDPSWSNMDEFLGFSIGRMISVYDTTSFQSYAPIFDDSDLSSVVLGYGWNPNSPRVAVSMREPNSGTTRLLIWSIISEQTVTLDQTLVTSAGSQLDWHPNGQLLATNQRGGVKIIDLVSPAETFLQTPYREDAVRAIAWNFDGSQLAAGGNQAVYVWDIQSQIIIETIPTENAVRDVIWSPDGEFLYHTGGSEGIYRNGIPLQEAICDTTKPCLVSTATPSR
jgi:WD40 repeat protein